MEGYERLAEMATELPGTRLVYLADREADIMELMRRADALATPVDWLLRFKHNCTLNRGDKLWSRVMASEPLGEIRFVMALRKGECAREVVQQVWAQTLQLTDGQDGFVQASCIVAREMERAAGDKPVEWRLLTNLPVSSLGQAARMIDWYRSRWEIETFFHVLKNGCRIEALQLGSVEKIERALVLYIIVAWRIARLMRLGRACSDLNAQFMFESDEWAAAFILNKKRPPDQVSTLNEVTRLVARLGGFLARTGDGEPGAKTIWLGMQRILDFAAGVRFSRELQATGSCV